MGGLVAMAAAEQDAKRIERIVLLDICGAPDEASLVPITVAVNRLGTVYPSAEFYVEAVQKLGLIEPWSQYWDRYFPYELEAAGSGGPARRHKGAGLEGYTCSAGPA